jgi:hypothetical protein
MSNIIRSVRVRHPKAPEFEIAIGVQSRPKRLSDLEADTEMERYPVVEFWYHNGDAMPVGSMRLENFNELVEEVAKIGSRIMP